MVPVMLDDQYIHKHSETQRAAVCCHSECAIGIAENMIGETHRILEGSFQSFHCSGKFEYLHLAQGIATQ